MQFKNNLLNSYPFAETFEVNEKATKIIKRQLVKERGKNCEWCGRLRPLTLHHIDHNQSNLRLENLKLYCRRCHDLIDFGKVTPNAHSVVGKDSKETTT